MPSASRSQRATQVAPLQARIALLEAQLAQSQELAATPQRADEMARRSGEALRESEQRFRTLVVHSPMGIFQSDLSGNCAFVNDRYCTIAGVSAGECADFGWLRTLHPEDRENVLAAWQQAHDSRSEFAMEFRFLHDDGTLRWVLGSAVPLDGAADAAGGYLGNVLDITNRKQADEDLSASEQRFRLLSNCSPVGIFLSDKIGNLIYTNPRLQAIYGYASQELLGTSFANMIHPDERDEALANWFKIAPTCEPHSVERRYLNRQGKTLLVHVRSAPLISSSGAVLGRVGTVEDITDRREGEQQLRRGEERYRMLAEHSTDMISKHAPDGVYLYASPACRALLGYEPEELIGRSAYDFFHPEDLAAIRELRGSIAQPFGSTTMVYRIRRKDGQYIWFETVSKSIADPGIAGAARIIAVSRDISERKRTQKMLHENEKLAATGRIAARIAHEINNPLAGIKNSFLLVKDAIKPDHAYFNYVARIESEIDRIVRIVRLMFDLYRPDPVDACEIDLGDVIREIAALLGTTAPARDVKLDVDVSGVTEPVRLHEDSIRQILYNIIANAIEASPVGGVVTVRASLENAVIDIFVADPGEGISENLRSQIYEPFFTTKHECGTGGLGLGLSISRGIVEAMQGTLDFECSPGQGTVFHISVPAGH
jgi:two-component system, sporulation sensor kinase A